MKFASAREFRPLTAIFVAAMMLSVCPVSAQAPNSPVGNHLVGTVLGTPATQGAEDSRETVSPAGLSDFVFQPNGDLIFASSTENRLYRTGAGGLVAPLAGDGGVANSADGGEAIAASIAAPSRLAADAAGNVYVAHRAPDAGGGSWIRRISPSGTIHKVAGSSRTGCPVAGSIADGADIGTVSAMTASADALYFAVAGCGKIYRIGADGLVAEFAGARFNEPDRIELREDFLAIPAKRAAFGDIVDLAVDPAGNVLLADRYWGKIVRVTPAGVVLRVAGASAAAGREQREGPATGVYLPLISSVAALADGSILVAQSPNSPSGSLDELGRIGADGAYRILFTSDGANGRPAASLGSYRIVPDLVRAAPDGAFYVRDRFAGMLLRVLPDGAVQHFLGLPPKPETVTMSGKLSTFDVRYTTKLAADAEGNLYLGALGKLYKLSPDGDLAHIAGNGGNTPGGGSSPLDAALGIDFSGRFEELQTDAAHSLYWRTARTIRKLAQDGTISDVAGKSGGGLPSDSIEGKPATSVTFERFMTWTVAANGDIYFVYKVPRVGIQTAPVIWRVGADGLVVRVAGKVNLEAVAPDPNGLPAQEAMLHSIDEISVSPDGSVFFAAMDRIFRIDSGGIIRLVAGGRPGTALADGMPTLSAPGKSRGLRAIAADQLLVIPAEEPPRLVKYTVGGAVQVWRDGAYGLPNNDGALLKDDRFSLGGTFPLILPDSGLAWIEVQRDRGIVRRGFPVPNSCTYTTSANELSVSGGNSLLSLTLTTGPECPWTLGSSSNWLEILSARYGKGATVVNLRAVANSAPVERVATLRVAGKEVLVRQGASVRPDIFVVSPVSAIVPPGGGSVRVTISASAGLPWQVALPQTPVGIEGPSAGSGSGSFVLSLGALPANISERTAVVSINGKTVTLRQALAAVPVPVTIDSTLAGAKAVIDLVERPLPYVAQWTPGSYHLLQAQPFSKANDTTLIEFVKFGASDPAPDLIFVAPSAPATLMAQFRRLYLLSARMEAGGLWPPTNLVTNFQGVPVPSAMAPGSAGPGGFARWYPEGSSIQVFAPEPMGLRFRDFTGRRPGAANPATILMDGPVEITANYIGDSTPRPTLLAGVVASWSLYGEERHANPAQVPVGRLLTEPAPLSRRFIEYNSPIGTPEWLSARPSGTMAPFTLEVGVDAAKAAGLKMTGAGETAYQAMVHLYEPGGALTGLSATARLSPVPEEENRPWIAALTDAGGFRQSSGAVGSSDLLAAPVMILSAFGLRFGTQTLDAKATPLPVVLGGVSVELRRSSSTQWLRAPLFFVSPTQINFQIPPALTSGGQETVYFRVRTSAVNVSEPRQATVTRRVASLFSADSSGGGAPAGFYVRVAPNGAQQRGDLYRCVNGVCTVPPTAFGGAANDLFLELYGTGFHDAASSGDLRAYIGGRTAEIAFAGPHNVFVGLDQVNIKVPRTIERGVPLDLYLWVSDGWGQWTASNRLIVRFE